jgi:hypothetical protein
VSYSFTWWLKQSQLPKYCFFLIRRRRELSTDMLLFNDTPSSKTIRLIFLSCLFPFSFMFLSLSGCAYLFPSSCLSRYPTDWLSTACCTTAFTSFAIASHRDIIVLINETYILIIRSFGEICNSCDGRKAPAVHLQQYLLKHEQSWRYTETKGFSLFFSRPLNAGFAYFERWFHLFCRIVVCAYEISRNDKSAIRNSRSFITIFKNVHWIYPLPVESSPQSQARCNISLPSIYV